MKWLAAEDILAIHFEIIAETGGLHGVRDIGLLASAAEKPKAGFGGKELYHGLFQKAAVYFEAIARYHVFLDGNKRTALAASARFLFVNGYELTVSNKAAEKFVLRIVTEKLEIETIALWLERHTRKRKVERKQI